MAVYCDAEDVGFRWSAAGVELRADDDPAAVEWAINRASRRADFYLNRRYDPAGFAGNDWVVEATADLAAVYLCRRRGNPVPASMQEAYDETIAELTEVKAGSADVPELTPRRRSAPQLSNVRVKRTPTQHVVVNRGRSPNRDRPTGYPQQIDPTEAPGEYNQ